MPKLAFVLLVICLQSAFLAAKYLSCPPGWVTYRGSSSCYRFGSRTATNWKEARKACLSMGGDLVKITSAQENRYVALLSLTYTGNNLWIGLMKDHNNVFHWVDGTALTGQYSNWNPGEPNGSNKEKCGMIFVNQRMTWNDKSCLAKMSYLCEKERPIY